MLHKFPFAKVLSIFVSFVYLLCRLPSNKVVYSCNSTEFVPIWKVYGFTSANNAPHRDDKQVSLNLRLPENAKIPDSLSTKWSVHPETHQSKQLAQTPSPQLWQQRLAHRTKST